MKEILLASNNNHKFEELSAILSDLPIRLIKPADLKLNVEIDEKGNSYYENALLKAEAFYQLSGLPVLADDSGLEVELLNNEPGIHSHRYSSKPSATDHDRCLYLLSKLEGKAQPWKATFHCHAVFYLNPQSIFDKHGLVHGEIIQEFRGENGFGYDPIFWLPEEKKTMAELGANFKNQNSHRANAFLNFTALRNWALATD
ncbi:MAG: RdgB/HAM1 family non-canonical purine NTP pyrophosphatase [Anaerolineaceae bacterium]|nr:RdgB/HAM1 family non-canonical purine NTP pyrophosphatase [Anaerolineaceae bacterium]